MADKKKMSVAEMLAAARKSDGDGDSGTPEPPAEETVSEETTAAAEPTKSDPPKKVAKPGSPDRPSVADMLAMARSGGKSGGGDAAEAKPAKKASPKAKPAAAKAEKPAAKSKAAPERDTASILAAARKSEKPGPMSKSEAAAKASAPVATKAKPAIVAPPMPAKPDYAKPKAKKAKAETADEDRRTMLAVGFGALGVMAVAWGGALTAFMFPNVLRELPSKFKVGTPDAFPPGQVSTKYKAQYGVWVVNTEYRGKQQLFALKSVCTHLGCTPSWLEAEQKFKCPCHGSGFYIDGVNFEGPAPRPLERCFIHVASDGQVEIDKNITYQEEMGQWNDPTCFISV